MNGTWKPLLAAGLAVCALAATAQEEEYHPKKEVFRDRAEWPATRVGQVKLKNFRPFRAVYDRTYTQGSGPHAGEERRDRVIMTAEPVGWDGRRAAAIHLLDSADPRWSDTNGRTMTLFADLDDLRALFEIGPLPGKAKDYYIGRMESDRLLFNMVLTEEQELRPQSMETDEPGFGPGTWVMASMKLREGMKINLQPYYSPTANPLSATSYGRVIGREEMRDGSGKAHDAWAVETSGYYPFTSPKVSRLYLVDQPPYYLGTENVNLDTGETSRFVWLRTSQTLEE